MNEKIQEVNKLLEEGEPTNTTKDPTGYGGLGYKIYSVILATNAIFGYDGWSTQVLESSVEFVGKAHKSMALVRIVIDGNSHDAFGAGINPKDAGDALKSAVSDATKKALGNFGIGARAYEGLLGKLTPKSKSKPVDPNWKPSESQLKAFHAKLKQLGNRWENYEEFKHTTLTEKYNATSINEVTEKEFNEIITTFDILIKKDGENES